ncbi:hypothetical protein Glove_130g41 [Diversispora epigaea]|uniref:SWIM-type domain-containing protein n=1 Tax=Diversispora epigaea TaxID=1348612 RepID=A0A397IY50_9GLOM|nr:hypothetical protein Glove_130g41 [Diversispora epigaea]
MDITTETNSAGLSNSNGTTNIDTTNNQSTTTLRRGESKGKVNVISEVTERNEEGSSLGKRRAAEDEDRSATTKKKRKSAKKRKGKKIRKTRYIKVCEEKKKRIERSMNQPMYMIDCKEIDPTHRKYSVLSPTGCVYTTDIAKTVSCSCHDFQNGIRCEHILFIFLRILDVDPSSDLIYQKVLIEKELKSIFNNSPNITKPSEGTVDQLKAIASRKQHNRKPIDDNCPCCYEPLGNQKILIWCESCGNNIHQDCFTEWEQSLPATKKVTCVICRAEWEYFY